MASLVCFPPPATGHQGCGRTRLDELDRFEDADKVVLMRKSSPSAVPEA